MITLFLLSICFSLFTGDTKGLLIKEIKGNEGRRWAICIGINDYWDEKISDLKKARNDAKDLAGIFRTIGQFNTVFAMTDNLDTKDKDFPSKFNIEDRIDFVVDMAAENDLIVFFFSGHGVSDAGKKSYLVAADARPDIDKLFSTSVALDYVVKKLKEKKIKKSLLLIDACREEMAESKSAKTPDFNANIYSKAEIAAIFYATKGGWFSYEDKKSDYGIFTRFLIEGLKGAADTDNDSIVSFSELEKFVMEAVFDYAVELNLKQQPYTKINEEKFGDLALTAAYMEKPVPVPKDMVLVKAGTFMMGSNDSDVDDDEKPAHEIRITKDFWMGKYEVTFAEYDVFCAATGKDKPVDQGWGRVTRPVIDVSWEDVVAYCNWKSEQDGREPCYSGSGIACDFSKNGYRLPAEAEWEFAARGGNNSKGYKYAGSNNPGEVAWCRDNSGSKTHPAGQKKSNELGLYDMAGNVCEWCFDWYDRYPGNTDKNDAYGTISRVVRGGSWNYSAGSCCVSNRIWWRPGRRYSFVGFRLAASAR